ncbi:MAG: SAM-dependent methyltransferase [Casimicrobiaceae bacterium]
MSILGEQQARLMSTFRQHLATHGAAAFDLTLPDGETHKFRSNGHGNGADPEPPPAFRLHVRNHRGSRALLSMDEYAIAEAYVNADIDVEGDILEAFGLRRLFTDDHPMLSLLRFLQPLLAGRNRADRKAIHTHYDLGNEFYWTFLDQRHRLYSQALYRTGTESLEQAAENKLNYIHDACRLGPGSRVLDLGAGWGAFSRFAASRGCNVTMLTLSEEQYAHLSKLSAEPSYDGRLTARLESIFELEPGERFDAIVLLGVMEHLPDYHRLMRHLDTLLEAGGYLYMDFVATRKKRAISTFTHRHVFPGDHSPVVMHELIAATNRVPLEIIAIHNDRHSYFLTAKAWAERLDAARDKLSKSFGDKAVRSFQLYLWSVANCLYRDGDLESYRVVLKKSIGLPSPGTVHAA